MVRLQPKLKRIREKYQDYTPQEKQQRIQQETNELYQREGYSSMGASCLPLLIQMPVLMGLYGIIRMPLTYVLDLSEEAIKAFTDAATKLELLSGKATAYAESIIISNIDQIAEKAPKVAEKFASEIETIRGFDFTLFVAVSEVKHLVAHSRHICTNGNLHNLTVNIINLTRYFSAVEIVNLGIFKAV